MPATLPELRKAKTELDRALLEAIRQFESGTELVVQAIDMEHIGLTGNVRTCAIRTDCRINFGAY